MDDEPRIRWVLRDYLEAEGYDVVEAADGREALALAELDRAVDLVLLDIALPGIDGLEVLRRIRTQSQVSVILVSARAEEVDRLVGLGVGADDYVTKPFSPREVVARVKAVLRRTRGAVDVPADQEMPAADVVRIDADRREITRGGRRVELSALEFDLFAALAAEPGRVFSRAQLLERVWGYDFYGDARVVDAHIRSIRRALADDATQPRIVATVRGVGYKFIGGRG